MKRIILLMISVAMILCLFAGCKSAGVQEESAMAGDLISGSAQEDADQDSNGPQKVENQQSGNAEQPGGNTQQGNNQQSGNTQQGGSNDQPSDDGQQGGNAQQGGDDTQQGGSEEPAPDNNGGGSDADSDDPYAAMIADESGTKVRLMTQNVRYNNAEDALNVTVKAASTRIYRLQKLIEMNDPDIIATQECDSFWVENLPKFFGDTYSMSYRYRESKVGSNEACAILYKTAKYNLTDSGTFWLSETPDQPSEMNGQYYPRIAHWVELEDKETGVKLLVFSTHFGFGYTYQQLAYIRGLFTKVCDEHSDAYPFMMGDYNIGPGSDGFTVLNDGENMIDLRDLAADMRAAGHCEVGEMRKGTGGAFVSDDGSNFIDVIFCQPRKKQAVDYYTVLYDRIAVEEKNIPLGPVSDHFAVVADVRVNTDVSYQDHYGDIAK